MNINLCGMELEHPVMNAAGMVKTIGELEAAVKSAASAIVIGSLTGSREERVGNPEPRSHYDHERKYMVNAMGLPEPGLEYYAKPYNASRWLALLDLAREAGKKIILSIAPMCYPVGWYRLLKHFKSWKVDAIELNLGCPNVWSDDGQKVILSFEPDAIFAHLMDLATFWRGPIGLKMSPYSNPSELTAIAQSVSGMAFHTVEDRLYIATANTFPNAVVMGGGKPYLSTTYGGFSGSAYKPIALGQVKQWVDALRKCDSSIPVVGVGGVSNGQDVAEFLAVGATAVQVGVDYWQHGSTTIERILTQWVDVKSP